MKTIGQNPSDGKERLEAFLRQPERSLFRLAIPIMFGMGIHVLYSTTDMIFVGRLGGDAIAAVTFSASFLFLMFSLSAINVGVQSLVARRTGAQDPAGAGNAACHGILLSLALGTLFLFAGRALAEKMLVLVGAAGSVLLEATTYLEILFLSAPFLFFSASARSILLGEGNSRTPVIIMVVATGLNILLDPVFIFVLGWGVPGAAWATVAAVMTSFTAYLFVLFVRGVSSVRVSPRAFQPSLRVLGLILRIGVPASLTQLIMSVGGMCFHRIISVFGSEAVAAYGVGGRVDMVIVLPFIGVSTALLSVVGMFHGAERGDLVERIARYAIRRTLLAAVLFGACVYLLAGPLLRAFTADASVLALGKTYLRFMVFAYPMIAYGMNSGRVLQGLGKGVPSLVITSTRVLLVSVPLSYLLTRTVGLGLYSVWVSILISGGVSTLISYLWLRSSFVAMPGPPPA